MMEMLVVGALTAAATLFVLYKINIYRVLWAEVPVDIAFTVGLLFIFAGTLGGMIAAVFAGLILSGALWFLKRRIGYARPTLDGYKVRWVHEGGAGRKSRKRN